MQTPACKNRFHMMTERIKAACHPHKRIQNLCFFCHFVVAHLVTDASSNVNAVFQQGKSKILLTCKNN